MTSRAHVTERLLLASLLTQPALVDELVAEHGLSARHFSERHRVVFTSIVDLHADRRAVDPFTVAEKSGVAYADVAALAGEAPVAPLVGEYAAVIADEARWRHRHDHLTRAARALSERDDAAYEAAALGLGDEPARQDTLVTPEQVATEFVSWLDNPEDASVVPLPFAQLNTGLLGGLSPEDTTIVAGWSSMGKSVWAAQCLEHVASLGGRCGLYVNEMSRRDMTARVLAGMTGVPFAVIRRRTLTAADRDRLNGALDKFPFAIIPVHGWPVMDVCRHIRRHRWDLACLDLFNRLPGRDTVQEVDAAIGGLCDAAAQSGCHLLVCAQLNQARSVTAKRPAPTGRDLRESGALYNDPANVMFVHRDQEADDERVIRLNTGMIYFDKARNGDPDTSVPVALDPNRMRFELREESWA